MASEIRMRFEGQRAVFTVESIPFAGGSARSGVVRKFATFSHCQPPVVTVQCRVQHINSTVS